MDARIVAVWMVLAAGCVQSADRRGPGSSDLEGVYEVSSHQAGACDAPLVDSPPPFDFFKVQVQKVVSVQSLVLLPCDGPTSCSSAAVDATYFAEFDDFEASGESTLTSFEGQVCTMQWHVVSLDSQGGDLVFSLRVEEVDGVDGIDIDDCVAQHEAWTGSTPCIELSQTRGLPAR